jgi:ferredoxin-NADP reductase
MSTAPTNDVATWRHARIGSRVAETPRAATLRLDVEDWPGHVAGQRVDLRLTAEDGYQATRAYSIASAPSDGTLDVTIERLDDGEVSPYFVDVAEPGDEFEVRGPIGGWFTWHPGDGGPLVLIGGGSGLVPLMAMVREAVSLTPRVDIRVLVSTRTAEDLLFSGELRWLTDRGDVRLVHTLTRGAPPEWAGATGRADAAMVAELLDGLDAPRRAYVCGPNGFVEHAADLLIAAGLAPEAVRTERFGPSS